MGRPSKKAKLTYTRDYELQTEALVRHVATTSAGSVFAQSERIPVPASPEKAATSNHPSTSIPPIPSPDFSQEAPDDYNDLGKIHFLSAPEPHRRYANSVSCQPPFLCIFDILNYQLG
jgi:hypothetical protein